MLYFGIYVALILLVNLMFSWIPLVETPIGMLSPTALVVGIVFVARDFAQRAVGHWVLAGIVIGAVLTWLMADPFVAYASVAAFVASELTDWVLYTVTKKPFYKRVWISSLLSTPVDTAVFLFMIDQVHIGTFILMVISKLVAAAAIWYIGHRGHEVYRPDPLTQH
jgi:uncharacterized PurR-regulated membrane protein YhhQ (DUF165 family)